MTGGTGTSYAACRTTVESLPGAAVADARRLDWMLMLVVVALCLVGAALVWSATANESGSGGDPHAFLRRHLMNMAIGLALGAATSLFDYRLLRAYAPFVYLLSVVGLIAVLSPLGTTINGSHSWLVLPAGFSVQPSEFAKVALVVGLAMLLAERHENARHVAETRHADVLLALVLAGVPLCLVMLQPDLGTALVISTLVLGVIVVAGAPMRWVAALVAAGAAASYIAVQVRLLKPYQVDRFTAFLDPSADPQGLGYNVRQAQIAIGSGGMNGQGLFHGAQTQGSFVPEQHTDFIFSAAGEELGFLGSAGVVVLLGVVLWRIGRIAARADDLFGRLLATGVLCWFAFQSFENIGMSLGIMPVTGVPLPFLSYGGSSMFASLLAVGLVQNVHLRRYN